MSSAEQTRVESGRGGDVPTPAEPAPTAPTSTESSSGGEALQPFLRANGVTLIAGAVAAVLGGIIWFALPHEHDITSLWVFLFKLTPFAAGAVAVAYLDQAWARRLRLPEIAIPACFLVFFCFFVPRMFFVAKKPGSELYYTVLTLVPFIILALALAYRIGGGKRGTTLRLCAALLLLQLSGLEDFAFLTVNHHTDPAWTPIPKVWKWADHMKVFLGHYPTKGEAYAFITVHVILALAVLFVPARTVRAAWTKARGGRGTVRAADGGRS
ncbi:hypothetical protein DZF91_32200 [Actinomadura logoneensis]|uniref:Uncharacterized protein n=1 Tax=Actinomadura logoneensis TaxID=2293572 RepID=A0A372JC30_9ACTN|nr:hypothetical protein [Actinomadura logoneensis]RFU37575.1 hypothetical protein DZF91_32200 [Actinomadura logoneensis]